MHGTKKLALVATAALSVSLIAASVGASVANAARPTHSASTAGRALHLGAAALHSTRTTPGVRSTHLSPATASSLGAGAYTGAVVISAGVTYKMPSFSCKSSSDNEWLLPGLWVFDGSGDLLSQVDVNFNCNSGAKLHEDVICINGASSCDQSLTPNPGDVMESVYTVDGSVAIGTLYDKTQGTSAQVEGTSGGETSILIGELSGAGFGVTAVPTFGKVVFNSATLNGFVISDWSPQQLNLQNGSDTQIKTGTISSATFTTKFAHNN